MNLSTYDYKESGGYSKPICSKSLKITKRRQSPPSIKKCLHSPKKFYNICKFTNQSTGSVILCYTTVRSGSIMNELLIGQ